MSKQPQTLRQMQRKLEADQDAAAMKRWIRRHPHSPEAIKAAEDARIASLRKFEAKMAAETRRKAREARKAQRDARINAQWLRETFEECRTTPGGLKRREGHLDGEVREVRTTEGINWRVVRYSGKITTTLWAKQALSLLNQPLKSKI